MGKCGSRLAYRVTWTMRGGVKLSEVAFSKEQLHELLRVPPCDNIIESKVKEIKV